MKSRHSQAKLKVIRRQKYAAVLRYVYEQWESAEPPIKPVVHTDRSADCLWVGSGSRALLLLLLLLLHLNEQLTTAELLWAPCCWAAPERIAASQVCQPPRSSGLWFDHGSHLTAGHDHVVSLEAPPGSFLVLSVWGGFGQRTEETDRGGAGRGEGTRNYREEERQQWEGDVRKPGKFWKVGKSESVKGGRLCQSNPNAEV